MNNKLQEIIDIILDNIIYYCETIISSIIACVLNLIVGLCSGIGIYLINQYLLNNWIIDTINHTFNTNCNGNIILLFFMILNLIKGYLVTNRDEEITVYNEDK